MELPEIVERNKPLIAIVVVIVLIIAVVLWRQGGISGFRQPVDRSDSQGDWNVEREVKRLMKKQELMLQDATYTT
jgi:hypothetical protein